MILVLTFSFISRILEGVDCCYALLIDLSCKTYVACPL
jgi:hypothetical protein